MISRLDIVVRSTEVDTLGHVNNSVYQQWMEWGRFEWVRHAATDFSFLGSANLTMVVVHVSLDYRREARREVALDIAEGADLVMVKPAGWYLDVLADTAAASPVPVAAYQISGEYAMIEAAAARGWIDRDAAILESLTAIRRAGADIVLSYWATEVAGLLSPR